MANISCRKIFVYHSRDLSKQNRGIFGVFVEGQPQIYVILVSPPGNVIPRKLMLMQLIHMCVGNCRLENRTCEFEGSFDKALLCISEHAVLNFFSMDVFF